MLCRTCSASSYIWCNVLVRHCSFSVAFLYLLDSFEIRVSWFHWLGSWIIGSLGILDKKHLNQKILYNSTNSQEIILKLSILYEPKYLLSIVLFFIIIYFNKGAVFNSDKILVLSCRAIFLFSLSHNIYTFER
jgi:hypothetical protein